MVQLATDPDFVVGVRLASSQDLGVGHGGGESDRFIVDRGIELADPVKPGEAVLTSGLSNSVMPPDIPIGLVDKVTPDENARVPAPADPLRRGLLAAGRGPGPKWTPQS